MQHINSPFRRGKALHGFTLIELLVVIAILSLLVSILLPSLNKAKDLARDTLCMSKQRGMASAWNLYAQDHGGRTMYVFAGWPNSQDYWWVNLIEDYLNADWNGSYDKTNSFYTNWFCPSPGPIEQAKSSPAEKSSWIGMNRLLGVPAMTPSNSLTTIRDPSPSLVDFQRASETVVFSDFSNHQSYYQMASAVFTYRHRGGKASNFALADGHVETARSLSEIPTTDMNGDGLADGFPSRQFVWDIDTNDKGYANWNYDLYLE